MASRKRWTVRRSSMGEDRVSASYLVERTQPVGRSLSAGYRFAKTAVDNATTFRSLNEAEKIMRSISRQDTSCDYAVIEL